MRICTCFFCFFGNLMLDFLYKKTSSGDVYKPFRYHEIWECEWKQQYQQTQYNTKTLALSCQKDRKNKYKYACGLMTKQTLTHTLIDESIYLISCLHSSHTYFDSPILKTVDVETALALLTDGYQTLGQHKHVIFISSIILSVFYCSVICGWPDHCMF